MLLSTVPDRGDPTSTVPGHGDPTSTVACSPGRPVHGRPDAGDLPEGTDTDLLARYLMATADGLAVQASAGATREELQQLADAAVRNWPPA
ncbi:hypothetical protein [Actinoplanes rectilineatus]|uniref:hypothetical protein n=1 Tax=Actinoplanes rectilineatus TaxID=113571 RepID=UPI0005F2ADB0|nr:hypothetical protein [Actinoplanes rectilineatus]